MRHHSNALLTNGFEKYWSVRISFLSDCYFADCYTHVLTKNMGEGFSSAIIIANDGMSDCYFKTADRKRYAANLIKSYGKSEKTIQNFCRILTSKAELLTQFLHCKQKMNADVFRQYLGLLYDYTGYHIGPRHMIDFLPGVKAEAYLPHLKEARIAVEHVYADTEVFVHRFAQYVARTVGRAPATILHWSHKEMNKWLETGAIPTAKTLLQRSAVSMTQSSVKLLSAHQAKTIEQSLNRIESMSTLKGTVAYPGITRHIVRIIHNPAKVLHFHDGNILVTSMTRPDFVPLMKKAGAVITDAGGLLCHAAITAREFKKPCIIGTKFATKLFKDGDRVEVDANKGIIRRV